MRREVLVAAVAAGLAVGLAQARGGTPSSDLSIAKTDGVAHYTAGDTVTYTITVANAGPDAAVGATVSDPVSSLPQVATFSWTCVGAGGATCAAGPSVADIGDTVDLPVGGTVTYTLVVKTGFTATGDLVNTATVTPPSGTTDPGPLPNTATDTDTPATLIRVATTGTDTETCGGAAEPCKTIRAAIGKAVADSSVVVGAGTYNECITIVPQGDPGGILVASSEFLSGGTSVGTILDGVDKCDVASGTPGPVATVHDKSRLLGFTIQHGGNSGVLGLGAVEISNNVVGGNTTSLTGGDIRVATGGVTDPLAKVAINRNTILKSTSDSHGAGIYVDAAANGVSSLIEIDDNRVTTNTTSGTVSVSGSGIAVYSSTSTTASSTTVVITRNTLDGNIATTDGGGILVVTGASSGMGTETVTVGRSSRGNIVRNNVALGLGGGISIKAQPAAVGKHTVSVDANTISANTGKRGGGGLHVFARAFDRVAGATPDVVVRATTNAITGNHAQGSLSDPNVAGGGGIYAELQSARTAAAAIQFEIANNTIERNDATSHGGGVSLLASADDDPANDGATAPTEAVIAFHHNLVAGNLARDTTAAVPSGGGVHGRAVARGASALARLTLDFVTVADNRTELGTGGIEWEDLFPQDSLFGTGAASLSLSNSIVVGNDGYGVGYTSPLHPTSTLAFSYNNAFGNVSGNYQAPIVDPTGDAFGNISVDAELDALHLPRLCGPMVDRGDPTIDASLEPLPNGGRVNLGHLGNSTSATRTFPDLNGDLTIDGLDVLGIAVSFNSCSDLSCTDHARFFTAADRDLNNRVDGEDLAYVSAFYGQSCP